MLKQYFQSNESLTRKLGMADEDIELILDICLYRGENLVVGSVASPQIANMLMYAFDLELKQMWMTLAVFATPDMQMILLFHRCLS